MVDISFTYVSCFTVRECIDKLKQSPLHFKFDLFFSRDYEITTISETKLVILFTKGYNLSDHRTEYHATFHERNGVTYITMKFVSEACGMPVPFVTNYEITKLFKERIDAKLVN